MIKLALGGPSQPCRRILCLGAHCDDIEIGCGGTILRLLEQNREREIRWMVFSSNHERKREALKCAGLFLESAKSQKVVVRNYQDSYFPFFGARIKNEFEKLKKEFTPDLVLTHFRNDLHQDHRLICDLTWNTFRHHLILEYEIPKYDGDLGTPNFFVPLEPAICERKIKIICQTFGTQRDKQWFTPDTFRALLRIRGMECNAPSKYAEAFYCRKMTV